MTKTIREQIISTWELAGEIGDELERNKESYAGGQCREFLELLEEYQNAIVAIGDAIDNSMSDEEQEKIIPALEEYCEEIYRLSLCYDREVYSGLCAVLKKKHEEISALIYGIPVKKTALFLPYKYSMWDSLESIYLAAQEDPDWEAVVMPIPYVERNKDSDEQEWKYEGASFADIPIVAFNEYDIAQKQPDVIYIHNPYDNFNFVTSVAPQYYSAELKKHCKLLVYVPYFFTGRIFPDIHLSMASYANIDYIILPSQDAYDHMKKYVPQEKLLVIGSPKIDKLLLMSEQKQIPSAWKERIRGRKTVLYNVSLNAILNEGFHAILKMRYIFDYFKKQSNLVLWWRPHPLMKSTIKSMCPQLLGAYEEMERMYVLEKIGIYDTTTNSNMAVAATDAFLGDYSSLCSLYGIGGKPIFLTDNRSLEQPTEEERRLLWPGFLCNEMNESDWKPHWLWDEDDCTYFYDWIARVFCKITRDGQNISVIRRMEESYVKVQAFHTKEYERTEIHFYPLDESRPGKIYHVASGTWSETDRFIGIPLHKYGAITRCGEQWVILPGKEPEFIYVDEKTGRRVCYGGFEEVLRPYSQMPEENLFGGIVQFNNCIYLLSYRVNKLLEFQLETKKWKLYDIGTDMRRYSTFFFDETDFWFFAWDGSCMVRWNKETETTKIYDEMPSGYEAFSNDFVCSYTPALLGGFTTPVEEEIIIFPNTANMFIKINKNTGKMIQWKLDLPYEEGQRKSSLYNRSGNYMGAFWYDKEQILLQTAYDGSLFLVNFKTGKVEERRTCLLPKEEYEKYRIPMEEAAIRNGSDSPYYYHEQGLHCTLKDMMDYFASGADMQAERQHEASTEGIVNADGTCGVKVHAYIAGKMKLSD
uniref:CDP-glycerol glycerophosphotransferase family protein n=1 Tax=Acetatifactor sp. TaxID=1872090 RepID=UPI004055AC22